MRKNPFKNKRIIHGKRGIYLFTWSENKFWIAYNDFSQLKQKLMRLFSQKQQMNKKNRQKKPLRNLHLEFVNKFSKHLIQYTGAKNVGSLFDLFILNRKVLRELPFMKNYCSTSKRSFHAHRHLTLWPVYLDLYLKSWRNFRNM